MYFLYDITRNERLCAFSEYGLYLQWANKIFETQLNKPYSSIKALRRYPLVWNDSFMSRDGGMTIAGQDR